ncbi:MAG: DUF4831 family protein [Bacteroidia bacterium]|nr:DUF4831 family protein [Bacteroidia bacterium]
MKSTKSFFIYLVFFFIVCSCSTVHVVNLNEVREIKGSPVVYILPKNVIRVNLELVCITHECGPYNRFAKKYLGINNQFTEYTTTWKISDIQIESYAVPDSSNIYFIQGGCGVLKNNINLSEDGILLSFNQSSADFDNIKQDIIQNLAREENEPYLFTDMSLKKIQVNKLDTTYKKVRKDTGFVKVPEVNSKIINKNLEEKAQEIANQIFDIREERISILTGDYKSSINGEAIKSIVEELNKIEEKYISLFTTITKRDTINYTFEYLPVNNKANSSALCYFSESNGISNKKDSMNTPVLIDVLKNNCTNIIGDGINKKTKKKQKYHGLYYRIPEYADARIIVNNDVLASKKMLISQFGTVMSLPRKMLKDNKTAIEFYKETGAIKSIKLKGHGKHRRSKFGHQEK